MKKLLLLMTVVCFCKVTTAQTAAVPEVNLDRYNKLRQQQQMAPLVEKWKQNQLPQGLQAKIKQPNAVQLPLSHTNALGEVYVLPQDNMPMLKPFANGANPMPGTLVQQEESNATKVGKIPNAIPVQPYTFQRGNQRK